MPAHKVVIALDWADFEEEDATLRLRRDEARARRLRLEGRDELEARDAAERLEGALIEDLRWRVDS